jgi:hypothetical protein
VSAADPVERSSGRLVHLSDSPFLLGEMNPVQVLAPQVKGPVIVDNDVNWAARAERGDGSAGCLDDFAYVFLGEGLGCAIVSDGEVSRGHAGRPGGIAQLVEVGPEGQARGSRRFHFPFPSRTPASLPTTGSSFTGGVMIPAIGYTMCGADRRRLQTTASHEPLSTAV